MTRHRKWNLPSTPYHSFETNEQRICVWIYPGHGWWKGSKKFDESICTCQGDCYELWYFKSCRRYIRGHVLLLSNHIQTASGWPVRYHCWRSESYLEVNYKWFWSFTRFGCNVYTDSPALLVLIGIACLAHLCLQSLPCRCCWRSCHPALVVQRYVRTSIDPFGIDAVGHI